MEQFSRLENQNRQFRKMAAISLALSVCVLSVYVLQVLGVIPPSMF